MNTVAETALKTPDRYETPDFNLTVLAPEKVETVQILNGWPIDGVRVGGGVRANISGISRDRAKTDASIKQVGQGSGAIEYLYPDQHASFLMSGKISVAHFGQNPVQYADQLLEGSALDADAQTQIRNELTDTFGPNSRNNRLAERFSNRSNVTINLMNRMPVLHSMAYDSNAPRTGDPATDGMLDFLYTKEKSKNDENILLGVSLNLKTSLKPNTEGMNFGGATLANNGVIGTLSVGVYRKFNLAEGAEPSSFVLRIEGGVNKHPGFTGMEFGGYGVAEIDIEKALLRRFMGSDGETHIGLVVPGSDTIIDMSILGGTLSEELTANAAMLDPQKDAAYFNADGTAKLLDLGLDNIGDQVQDFLSNYIPAEAMAGVAALAAYAPEVATAAQYAPTAYRTARVAQAINAAVRSGTARALIADSGPAIVYSAGIAMTIQTLTDPAVVNYAITGEQNPALSITSALDNSMTEVSPWAFDTWVADGDASYPQILDILQTEANAPERDAQSRAEAQGYIENTPALRYLGGHGGLEAYAETHGLDGGIYGANAAQIAEALVQGATPAQRAQIIADLENQFGLIRDNDDLNQQGGWWVTASDVDQGDGKPMKDQSKLWDKLATMWRSEFKQKQIDRERAVEVISTFAQDLGLHITPEIAGKIADKARA